jgi:hypothetical protein
MAGTRAKVTEVMTELGTAGHPDFMVCLPVAGLARGGALGTYAARSFIEPSGRRIHLLPGRD